MTKDAYEARVTTVWLGQSMALTIRADSAGELERRVRDLKRVIASTKRPDQASHTQDGQQEA